MLKYRQFLILYTANFYGYQMANLLFCAITGLFSFSSFPLICTKKLQTNLYNLLIYVENEQRCLKDNKIAQNAPNRIVALPRTEDNNNEPNHEEQSNRQWNRRRGNIQANGINDHLKSIQEYSRSKCL